MDTRRVSILLATCMKKSKDLRLRLEPQLFEEFSAVCKSMDIPVSQVLRHLMTQFVSRQVIDQQEALFGSTDIAEPSSSDLRVE